MIDRGRARRAQRLVGMAFAAFAVALLANSLFLWSSGGPGGLVAFMTRLHVILGYVFGVALVGFVLPHLILHIRHRNRRAQVVGIAVLTSALCGTILGIILHLGHFTTMRSMVQAHEIVFVVALAAYMSHRLVARVTPIMRPEFAATMLVLLATMGLWAVHGKMRARPSTPEARGIADFGASNASTVDGHWLREQDLSNPQYCAQCHTEIARQWQGSAHHFSSLNDPFYKATFAALQRNRPPSAAKFCGGCHDPLIVHTGNMEATVTESTPNALEGITCLACHAVVASRDRLGNGGYVVAAPEHYPYYGSKDPNEQEMNRRLIRAKPAAHIASFMRPEFRQPEFCLQCHKAFLDVPVNHYRWKRGQNDYDAWFESSVAKNSARTFYTAPERKRCQDCHMPDVPTHDPAAHDGLSRDHTFAGANMALAQVAQDTMWARKTRAMLKGCASVDLLAAVVDADRATERRLYPLESPEVRLAAGHRLRIDVVVRNRKVGHMFPGGTADLNEPWLEFIVARPGADTLYVSGNLDHTGRLDPGAHRFHALFLTKESRKLEIHEVESFYTALYVNTLQLGDSDIVRYEFEVPSNLVGSRLHIVARLRYRKFSREYTEFALGPQAQALPIVDIAADSVDVAVGGTFAAPSNPAGDELAGRLNDFGIGHLRQGDTRIARWAFERVAALQPGNPDAFVNLARVDLAEGALDRMETSLKAADRVKPGLAKTAYFLGRLRVAQGRFEEAERAYDITLAEFPRDREVLNQKGIALYKLEKFEAALAPLQATLAIDPDNVTAHSYMSRCLAALGRAAEAQEHESAALRLRTEENERTVTEIFRRNHPESSREADPQHVHPLGAFERTALLTPAARPALTSDE